MNSLMEVMALSTYNPKTNKELKINARGQLIGKYQMAIFASLIVSCITMLVTSISDANYTGSLSSYLIRYLIVMIVDLLSGVLIYGQTRFFLKMIRGEERVSPSEIFYGIKNNTDKAILVQLPFTLATIVASVPGLLISLGLIAVSDENYSKITLILSLLEFVVLFAVKLFLGLSFYILCDHPEMEVMDIFKESIHLMENRKGRYFLLCLSLIPLLILGVLAFVIGIFWYVAFVQVVNVNFYLDAINEEPFNPSVDKTESYKETVNEETSSDNSEF